MVIPVTVYHRRDNYHCSQIFTGLGRLHRQGVIDLLQKPWRSSRLADLLGAQSTIVVAEVRGRLVCFDMRDEAAIDCRFLDEVDLYFKRSYDPDLVCGQSGLRRKVRALGLNYDVWDDGADWPAVQRLAQGTGSLGSLVRRLGLNMKFQPRVGVFESEPDIHAPPRVLFLTRLWGASRRNDSHASQQDRERINETRILCVRALKSEFGAEFVGGIEQSDLASRLAPDLICPPAMSAKGAYLRLVKSTPICVTTTGLHGSNGWKLAEYVASARAIVCEPLRHSVPGEFSEGRNYLAFASPEACVEQAARLRDDRDLRLRMMWRNLSYYRTYLRPEAMVRNALEAALDEEPGYAGFQQPVVAGMAGN